MSAFVDVGDVSNIPPGTMRGVDVVGKKLLIVNLDGAFYALEGICTHAYAELASGFLAGDRVVCPLHLSRFDVRTGDALSAPADVALRTFRAEVRGPKVAILVESESA